MDLFLQSFPKPLKELLNVLRGVLSKYPRSTWNLNPFTFLVEIKQLIPCKEPILGYKTFFLIQPIPKEAEFTL